MIHSMSFLLLATFAPIPLFGPGVTLSEVYRCADGYSSKPCEEASLKTKGFSRSGNGTDIPGAASEQRVASEPSAKTTDLSPNKCRVNQAGVILRLIELSLRHDTVNGNANFLVVGSIRNDSRQPVTNPISILVELSGIGTGQIEEVAPNLGAGQQTSFVVPVKEQLAAD